ncbi:MAG: calcium/proton exchanger, partial [Gemmatimonadales bacterium]
PRTLSSGAQRALQDARAEAQRLGHDSVGAEHILLGLLRPGGPAAAILERLKLDPATVRERLEAGGRKGRPRGGDELAYTSHAKRLIEIASKEAREAGTGLSAEHLLLAALHEPRGTMARILNEAGLSPSRVRAEIQEIAPATDQPAPGEPAGQGGRGGRPSGKTAQIPTAPKRTPRWRLVLLAAVPVSIVLGYVLHAPAVWVFLISCLGVLPLAGYMGEATEHLAHRTGPTIGGLLNATFGNAAELIIALVALRAGLVDLVKASISGSILGNLLLILGLALVVGGVNRSELRFNRTNAGMSAGMLALSVVALVFPALYHSLHPESAARLTELRMSEAVALILLAIYGLSLLFTLRTHRRLFSGDPHPTEGPVWSVGKALLILAVATVGVAVESELLVHAATEATETLGLSPMFLGLIVIPIIGNAAEHAAAVVLSRKGQLDLGFQIALGSSTQIALLVAPILVFAGVVMGQDMNLVFKPFEVLALGMATIVISIITLDGESHWFEGAQLLAVYAMVAVGAFFLI